jgi:hypothetical protein
MVEVLLSYNQELVLLDSASILEPGFDKVHIEDCMTRS